MMILSGLSNASVLRLKKTWQELDEESKTVLEQLQALISPNNCSKKLRQILDSCTPPCLPYLGLYLTDLTFIHDGVPQYFGEGMINFQQMRLVAKVINQMKKFQLVGYTDTFPESPEITEWLLTVSNNGMTEEDAFTRSRQIESRTNNYNPQLFSPQVLKSSEYKLVIFGAGGVGKSALIMQFLNNSFNDEYDPTIEDSYRKQVNIDQENCFLDIVDTGSREEYSAFSLRAQYMKAAQGFMFVYAVTSRNSFDEVTSLRNQTLRVVDNFPMVLVGNKCDLEDLRQVTKSEGCYLAQSFGVPFFETSAKLQFNVEEAFFQLVREIRNVANKKDLVEKKEEE